MNVALRLAIALVVCASSAYAQQRDPEIVAIRMASEAWSSLGERLACYGTAHGPHRPVLCAKQPFLPGFEAYSSSLVGQHG